MDKQKTIEHVFDEAFELLKRGNTIPEIVRRYPKFEHELEELLRTAQTLIAERDTFTAPRELHGRIRDALAETEPIRAAVVSFRKLFVRTLFAVPAGVAVILFILLAYSQTRSPALPAIPTLEELTREAAALERDSETKESATVPGGEPAAPAEKTEFSSNELSAPAPAPAQTPSISPSSDLIPSVPTSPSAPQELNAERDRGAETVSVAVFFPNSTLDPNGTDCSRVFAVARTIPKTTGIARAAIEELLRGVTFDEATRGYATSINPGGSVNRLAIENGVASVDFNETLELGVGGSCRVTSIRSQIERTLKQFLNVRDVVISINGRTKDILQP